MGWTYTHRGKGETNKQFFGEDFWAGGYELVDIAQQGFNTIFMAVRRPDGKVFGTRTSIKWVGGHYNFGYSNTWAEDDGPGGAPPARILDQLSPLGEMGYNVHQAAAANAWRQAGREYNAKRAGLKLRTGATLELETPIKWKGAELKRLYITNARRRTFKDLDSWRYYKISRGDLIAAGARAV